ncbi:MAG: hypothetical protein AAFX89_10950 [Pseudomonadota bacterium]
MRQFVFSALFALGAQTATAQEAAPCGGDHAAWLETHAEEMTGTWTDTPVFGLMVGQPMPLGPPEPVLMTAIPNGFSTIGEEPVREYQLLLTDEPFAIDPPGGPEALARLDTVETPDCAISDLPHLAATYTLEIDGQPVEGSLAAIVASTTTMHIWFVLDTEFGRIEQLSRLTR